MRALLILTFSFSIVFVNAQACNPDDLISLQVRASDTDDAIDFELFKHYTYYNPSCVSQNTLVVHLVGSFDNPVSTQLFPSIAANNGFHVVSLKYENDVAAQTACSESADSECYYNFRKEIISGVDLSEEVEVNEAHSINNRLIKLLQYLDDNNSDQNWSEYFTGNNVEWNKIIISGHSQGGGHAALIGKEQNTKRVLMFASPNDFSNFFDEPAPWTSDNSLTNDSLFYGFNNVNDNVVPFDDQMESWVNLGMPTYGELVNVDNNDSPYSNSRQLFTSRDTTGIGGNHSLMILDSKTPLDLNGIPIFLPVWKYMLGIGDGEVGIEENETTNGLVVFPNPVAGVLNIQSSGIISEVVIYNYLGKLVETIKFDGKGVYSVSLVKYESGIYNILIKTDKGTISKKIVVE